MVIGICTLLWMKKPRICSVGNLEGEAGRGPSPGKGELKDAGARDTNISCPWSLCGVVVRPGGLVTVRPEFESLFSHSLTNWMTWGYLLNLVEHQPSHVVNENNCIYLAGLSEDSMRASVWHAWNTVGVQWVPILFLYFISFHTQFDICYLLNRQMDTFFREQLSSFFPMP